MRKRSKDTDAIEEDIEEICLSTKPLCANIAFAGDLFASLRSALTTSSQSYVERSYPLLLPSSSRLYKLRSDLSLEPSLMLALQQPYPTRGLFGALRYDQVDMPRYSCQGLLLPGAIFLDVSEILLGRRFNQF